MTKYSKYIVDFILRYIALQKYFAYYCSYASRKYVIDLFIISEYLMISAIRLNQISIVNCRNNISQIPLILLKNLFRPDFYLCSINLTALLLK